MQSNIEGFFKIRPPSISAQSSGEIIPSVQNINQEPITIFDDEFEEDDRSKNSKTNLMNLLSGQQDKKLSILNVKNKKKPIKEDHDSFPISLKISPERLQPLKASDEITTFPVSLKISPEKLQSLKKSRINPRDLFSKTTVVRRKLIVSLKIDPSKLQHIEDSVSNILTDGEITEDDDELERVDIKSILGTKKKRKPSENEIEILAESKMKETVFKSKVSASSVLQSFKERQQEKQLIKEEREIEVSNNNTFFQDVAERALISKLMKEKGVNKTILEPTLSKNDFHIYDTDERYGKRKLTLPKKKETKFGIDIQDDRFGPIISSQEHQSAMFKFTYNASVSDLEIEELILTKIANCNGNSRLIELLSLNDNNEFQELRKQNNLLLCNLFKPRNHHSLLIPSKKAKQLSTWFKDNFRDLPKKKPNRAHLFKKIQDDSFNELDSFVINDSYDLIEEEGIERDQELPVLVVTGANGCGKTAAIEAILNDLNAYIYSLDSSTIDKKEVREMAIHQKYNKHMKQDSCIVFDEIPDDDETFFNVLKHILIVTRKPIVLTISNEELAKLPHWLSQVTTFEFKKINEALIVNYLSIIASIMRFDVDNKILNDIISSCKYDLRRSINELQLLVCGVLKCSGGITRIEYSAKPSQVPAPKNIDTLLELDLQHHMKFLSLDNDQDAELCNIRHRNIINQYNNATDYFNSKNSYKFSKRLLLIIPKHFEFQSLIYNLNSNTNTTLFRLEFFEFLIKIAQIDSLRELHDRKFRHDPLEILHHFDK